MALCLANSLVCQSRFNLYDQLVRYKWWYKKGYMSSTGECFDIGAATSQSLNEFERRQSRFIKKYQLSYDDIDYFSDEELLNKFKVDCSESGVAGNGALMRLAPVPLFFYRSPSYAVEYSGRSGRITHGDTKAYDACRYYGALIVAALHGYSKDQLLDKHFYSKHNEWFRGQPLCTEIKLIAEGSYRRPGGYKDGIRGKGYIVDALEAALWAFWSDGDSFEKGALAAVNLGDDTDTTAAIYGQLAGAYYGYKKLPRHWLKHAYAKKFIINLSQWIAYEGQMWQSSDAKPSSIPESPSRSSSHKTFTENSEQEPDSDMHPLQSESPNPVSSPSENTIPEKCSARRAYGRNIDESSAYNSPFISQPMPGSNSYQNSEEIPPTNSVYRPSLPATSQFFPNSIRAKSYETTIDPTKQLDAASGTSSNTKPGPVLLKKMSSEGYPTKPVPSAPPAKIPEFVPEKSSKSESSRPRHNIITTTLNTFRRRSRPSSSSMQVPFTNINGTTSPKLTVNRVSKRDQKQQLSTKNKSPQTSRSAKNGSNARSPNTPAGVDFEYM